MSAAQEAPALPGEVWRDADDDGLHIAIIKRDGVHMARWWSVDRRAWICADTEESAPIFAAWGRAKAAEVDRLTRERAQLAGQRDAALSALRDIANGRRSVTCLAPEMCGERPTCDACRIDEKIRERYECLAAQRTRAEQAERERDEARAALARVREATDRQAPAVGQIWAFDGSPCVISQINDATVRFKGGTWTLVNTLRHGAGWQRLA